ncbi:MAG: DUF1015 domain-containing protein [Mesoaciditoga sp.]|uniref:DUF1015 domain-containing protein n=1 Tax=Athalassotoga sp. TaxID=2022597 RepID=UPI000CB48C9A|nr:MAG: DUF1015 domain-containing protein [Mesoaciditoga sp.]PMP80585.1 MAG: DUF1015 domain-containing protein [Mesoaciditoga sp.]HEU23752.1 DUF1015 domain-containing protein [Mesoaciditoga lauensis]
MIVRPFGGLEAKSTEINRINCPPYDVVDFKEAKDFAKDPHSFMRIVRPDAIAKEGENIYDLAAKELKRFVDEGLLIRNERPSLYIYVQKTASHTQTGVMACVQASDYPEKIKRHELTRKEKEEERMKHILTTRAHTEQVFLMYRSKKEIKKLMRSDLATHLYKFTTENPATIHDLYRIEDSVLVDDIIEAFKSVEAFYIADGHHRAAASVRAASEIGGSGEWNYFMATIFPHDELEILGYHRIIKKSIDTSKLIKSLKEANFEVTKRSTIPSVAPHVIGMYNGEWYELKAKVVDEDPVRSLDVSILQERVLDPLFGIKDPRTDPDIEFVGMAGPKELQKIVDDERGKIAFYMYPTSVESVINVADSGMIMPPKSTWFEPKLRSGLVVHTF